MLVGARLERAKKAFDVRSRRVHRNGEPVSYWLLPGQKLGPEHYDGYEIDHTLRELQKVCPLSTPLDEEDKEW